MAYYKSFREDGRTLHDHGSWPLPKGNKPGTWVKVQGALAFNRNGLHVMRKEDLAFWPGSSLFEVEIGDEFIEADNKVVCRKARLIRKVETWNHRTLVAWACDCAKRVLPIFEKECPKDKRPRKAIRTTRKWLRGEATLEEVEVAAHAARTTARAACAAYTIFDPATSACAAAYAAYAIFDPLRDACASIAAANAAYAASAAAHAANSTTAHTAYSTERKWQSKRMMKYIRGEVKP